MSRYEHVSILAYYLLQFFPSHLLQTTEQVLDNSILLTDVVLLLKLKSMCPMHSEAKEYQNISLEQRKVYYMALQGDALKTPNSLKAFSKALF